MGKLIEATELYVIETTELYDYYDEMITKKIKGFKRVDIFKERWDEGEFEYKMEALGIKTISFDDENRYDCYSYGIAIGLSAAELKTNIIWISSPKTEKLITIFADNVKQAKEKIDALFNYIVEIKNTIDKTIKNNDNNDNNDNKEDGERAEKTMLEYLLKKYGVPKEFLR